MYVYGCGDGDGEYGQLTVLSSVMLVICGGWAAI